MKLIFAIAMMMLALCMTAEAKQRVTGGNAPVFRVQRVTGGNSPEFRVRRIMVPSKCTGRCTLER